MFRAGQRGALQVTGENLSYTAGINMNCTRMELALAELGLEETRELEDDVDFVNDKGT